MFSAALKSGAAAAPLDPDFKNVTMLLHGDGTNGAQNNTFLDSSTNNFTITRNGNTTQGSFSPYGAVGNFSTFFSGSSQNLYTPSTTALNVGSGNFTIECFLNVSAFNGGNILRGGNQYSFALLLSGTSVIYYLSSNGSSWNLAEGLTAGSGLSVGTWCHLALVRNGNTFTPYVNGVAGTTTTSSSALSVLNGFNIGAEQNSSAFSTFNGYISNVRVVVGTAVYTSNFTPPTTPLTAVGGTQLLACQNNRFIDNSSNNFTFTTAGTPSVQRFSPFAPPAAYNPATIGGSGYFDGAGDKLTIANSAEFTLGTNWSMEAWIYPTSLPGSSTIFGRWFATVNNANYLLYIDSTGAIIGGVIPNAGVAVSTSGVIKTNCWQHTAMTWDGTTLRIFVNGVVVATTTSGQNITANGALDLTIGGNTQNDAPFVGYMTDVRFLKGTAIYTSAFTPPTAPLTAITNTSLLLNYTNGAIFDNAMMNDLETVGNAQISTSVVKYGTGSMAFDGLGDYLTLRYGPYLQFPGNFTVEFWVNPSAKISAFPCIINNYSSYTTNGGFAIFAGHSSANINKYNVAFNGSFPVLQSTSNIAYASWTHLALVRNGSTLTLYVNGVSEATSTQTAVVTGTANSWWIGAAGDDLTLSGFQGYIDDLRITKGVARYTANFTPPTAAFPDR